MAMELGSPRWTNTGAHPFGPAPGSGGLASTKWTSTVATPFGPAPGGGRMGGMFESGFAAQEQSLTMDAEKILKQQAFSVKQEPVKPGDIASMVIRFVFTDRGTLTKKQLDSLVYGLLKKAGYKVSLTSSYKSHNVTWRWGKIGVEAAGDVPLYVPVVSAPAAYAGLRYAGNVFGAPLYTPDAKAMAPLPGQIWVYTMAVPSAHDTMTDGDAAQVTTLLKQSRINIADAGADAYSTVWLTLRGCPVGLFKKAESKIVKAGWSSLLLLVAYNMVAPHIGSEVL